MARFTYLFGNLALLVVWTVFWLRMQGRRTEMLHVGVLTTVLALPFAPWLLRQWWQPATMTGTLLGVEDLLFLFLWGGIAAAADDFVLGPPRRHDGGDWRRILPVFAFFFILFIGLQLLGVHMWVAWTAAALTGAAVILAQRPVLWKRSLASAAVCTLVGVVWFVTLHLHDPAFIDWYHLDRLTGILMFYGPVEDYVWAFTSGLLIGPLWPLITGER